MNDSTGKSGSESKLRPDANQPNASSGMMIGTPIDWAKVASFVVLLIVIIVVGMYSLRVMQSFLLPLFLAALVVVIFRPVHSWILKKTNGRKRISAMLTTAVVVFAVLGPLASATKTAIKEGAVLTTVEWNLSARLEKIRRQFGLQMPHKEMFEQLQSEIDAVTPVPDDESDWKITNEQADVLADIDEGLTALEAKIDAPEQSKTQEDLIKIRDSIAQARDSAAAILTNGPTIATKESYDKAIARLGVQLENIREDLTGGFPRSSLVRLANPGDEELERWQTSARDYLQQWLLSVSGKSTALLGSLLFGLAIMLIAIYYFLIDGPEMIKTGMRLSPLDDQYEEELLIEFGKVSRAVVLATLLSAVVQGLLAGIGYFFAGFEPVFLLTVMTMMLAMVPFVGAAAIWIPAALYLAFIDNRIGAGIGLAIYGAVVVSMADNVIKPFVLHGQSNLHPLMALLSVLGGVQALGPIGILVGPMLLAFLQAVLNMLRKEIGTMSPS